MPVRFAGALALQAMPLGDVGHSGDHLPGQPSAANNLLPRYVADNQPEERHERSGPQRILGTVREVHVDMGYRRHDYVGNATIHVDKRQRGRTPKALWKRMKHRAAVKPSIGHLKNEHRLERNRLKGVGGDAINAIRSAAR